MPSAWTALTLRRGRRPVRGTRRLAAGPGPGARRAGRDHDAQRAAVSRSRSRPSCAPATRASTSIRSTRRASWSTSCKDSGAAAIVVLENFANTLEEVIDAHRRQARGAGLDGRPAGLLEGPAGSTSPCATCARWCRRSACRWTAGARSRASTGARRRRAHEPEARRASDRTTSPSCSTPAARPACPRARRCCIATSSPTSCRPRPGSRRCSTSWATSQLTIVCALPLYHIFALTACCMLGARLGMTEPADPEPARHPRLRQDAAEAHQVHMFPAVNTLFNALANDPEFARLDFSELVVSNGGGMAVQQATAREVAQGHRLPDGRRLRPVARPRRSAPSTGSTNGVHRHHRPAAAVAPRSRSATTRARRCRSASPARSASAGPQVMAGYWNRPDETAQVMTADGFFAHRRHRHHGRATATSASSTARRT